MDTEELQHLVIDALDDLKARDVRVLDVRGKSSVTDVMVIASGSSDRQVKSLAGHVVEKSKESGVRPIGVEGEQAADWVVIDLGDVVVHIMRPEVRDFYNLEKLWEMDAPADVENDAD